MVLGYQKMIKPLKYKRLFFRSLPREGFLMLESPHKTRRKIKIRDKIRFLNFWWIFLINLQKLKNEMTQKGEKCQILPC